MEEILMEIVTNDRSMTSYGPAERQAWIGDYILEQGSILVDELAELFSVSRMTIHRDLDDLEQLGVLRKVRNGATALRSSFFESDIRYRIKHQMDEKRAIAKAVLSYIEPGQSIFLDEATTLLPLARLLPSIAPLTVITNFLPMLKELTAANTKGIRIIALGGEYLHKYDTFTGVVCEQTVASLHADLFLTSVTAMSNGNLYHPEGRVIRVKQAMMANASKKFMLLDHTKFGKAAVHLIAPARAFDMFVVDSLTDPMYLDQLRELEIEYAIAPVETLGERG